MADQEQNKSGEATQPDLTIRIADTGLSRNAREAHLKHKSGQWDEYGLAGGRTSILARELANLEGIVDFVRDVVSQDQRPDSADNDLPLPQDAKQTGTFSPVSTDLPSRDELPPLQNHYLPGMTFAGGGQGLISQAQDRFLKRHVALKSLRKELLDKPEQVEAFMTEAMITAQLSHPSIISIYALMRDNEHGIHLAMQLISGATLQERLTQTANPIVQNKLSRRAHMRRLKTRLELFLRICDPIAYAHSKGIIHCDLKPENIMLGKYGEVYVMDWGIARVIRDKAGNLLPNPSRDKLLDGTPRYLPPEAFNGVPRDERADIYALGLILYNMCTLRNCYEGDDQEEILANIRNGHRNPVEHRFGKPLPTDLVAVIEKAIARKPEERYAHVADLAEDVRRLIIDEEVNARPDPLSARILRFVRHNIRTFVIFSLLAWLIALISSGNALKESLLSSRQQLKEMHTSRILGGEDGVLLQNAIKLSGRLLAISEGLKNTADSAMLIQRSQASFISKQHLEAVPASSLGSSGLGIIRPGEESYFDLEHFTYHFPDGKNTADRISKINQYRPVLAMLRRCVIASEQDQRFSVGDKLSNETFANSTFLVKWAYLGLEADGMFLIYPANNAIGNDYDCRKREWYLNAKENFRKGITSTQWSKPYMDINSTQMVATCTMPLLDAERNFIGVCAMDLDLTALGKDIAAGTDSTPEYILEKMLFAGDGTLIFRHTANTRNSGNIALDTDGIFKMLQAARNPSGSGHFLLPDGKLSCHYVYLHNLDSYMVDLCDLNLLLASQAQLPNANLE